MNKSELMKLQMKSAKVQSPAFIHQNPVIRAVSLSADIYSYLLKNYKYRSERSEKPDRDRFQILPKDMLHHNLLRSSANRGYFPVEDLKTLRHIGSYLQAIRI